MNEVIFGICICSVIAAIFRSLVPSEKFDKQAGLVISCFFVVSVLGLISDGIGIGDIKELFTVDNKEYVDYSGEIYKMTADETAAELRSRIKDELLKNGIETEKIYIGVNISDTGSISISEIGLVLDDFNEYDAERAVMITKSLTGNETEVKAE